MRIKHVFYVISTIPSRIDNYILVKKYPWLYPKNSWTGKKIKKYDYVFNELSVMPDGWYKVFGKKLIKEIGEELKSYNYEEQFLITECKEKYGELRIYHNGAPGRVEEIIDNYTTVSSHCCMRCGKPDVGVTSGWIEPICKHCWDKSQERYYKRGITNKERDYEENVSTEDVAIPNVRKVKHWGATENYTLFYTISPIATYVRKHWKMLHPIRSMVEC